MKAYFSFDKEKTLAQHMKKFNEVLRMSIARHEKPNKGATDTWLTPPEIIRALGEFDTDPCVPEHMPWKTATRMITESECGLKTEWTGRVFMNPPYSKNKEFAEKFKKHGNGICLVFARTETAWFQNYYGADAFLFLSGRLHFHHIDGKRATGNSGAPTVMVAIGERNVEALREYQKKTRRTYGLPERGIMNFARGFTVAAFVSLLMWFGIYKGVKYCFSKKEVVANGYDFSKTKRAFAGNR